MAAKLDDLDRDIIRSLQRDGRRSNVEIARDLQGARTIGQCLGQLSSGDLAGRYKNNSRNSSQGGVGSQ